MSIIEFRDVSFTPLGEEGKNVRDISFHIKKGTVTVFLGDSQSGNSTVLGMLNRLVPCNIPGKLEGDIVVDGVNIVKTSANLRDMATKIGFVLQQPDLQIVSLTVKGDITFGPQCLGYAVDEINKWSDFAIEAVRLKGFEVRNPKTLSGGEIQALAIGGVLAMNPKILAMVDPVAALDPMGKTRVYSILKHIRKEYGTTILLSEPGMNIESATEIADRIVVMSKGEIVADDAPSKVFENEFAVRVGIPEVTQLFIKLRGKNRRLVPKLPATLDDAERMTRQLLEGKRIKTPERTKVEVKKRREPIIRIKNLRHTFAAYPPVEALKGIDLEIYPGEFVGLIGNNGGGKSTLALHLVGIWKPTNKDAEVIVDGLDVANKKTTIQEILPHINYVFQNPDVQLFCQTVEDEMAYGLQKLKKPAKERESLIAAALKRFNIEAYRKQYIMHLPRDVKTYLAEASVVAMDPKVLIIDEPTGGLDMDGATLMMESLLGLNEAGKTIIIITHDQKVVAKYCGRVIAMGQGNIILDGSTREVYSQHKKLEEFQLAPPQITQLGQRLSDLGFPDDVLSIDEMYDLITSNMISRS